MALKTFVKISGVNNLSDARYCAGMGVDLIGFDLEPESDNYTDLEKFSEISDWISGVEFVGEFKDSSARTVIKALNSYNLSVVQTQDYGMIDSLQDVKTILRVNIEDLNSLPFNLGADFLLVHSKSTLNLLQIQEIQKRVDRIKVLLDCDIQASSVLGLIEETRAYGISLTAGHEIRPGYKDYDELADILETLETDD